MSPPPYHRAPPLSTEAYRDLLKVLEGQQVIFPQRLVDTILLELGLYPVEDPDEVIVYDPHCMTRRHHGQQVIFPQRLKDTILLEPGLYPVEDPDEVIVYDPHCMTRRHHGKHSSALLEKSTYCEMRNIISTIKQPFNGEGKGCGNLCQDILESILGWLCPADYLRCGAVCSWWRTIVGNAIRSKHCKPTLQLPLLMLNLTLDYDKEPPCFYSLSKQKLQFPNKPLYSATQHCIGSVDGWLIMMDIDSVNDFLDTVDDNYNNTCLSSFYYFLNPVSCDRVLLRGYLSFPDNLKEEDPLPLFKKMVASSIPIGKDCCVAGLSNTYLAYGRLDDKPWTLIEPAQKKYFQDIEIHDGKLYVVLSSTTIESIMVYDLQFSKDCNGPKAQKLVVHDVQCFLNFPRVSYRRMGNIRHIIDDKKPKLVRDAISGELFLVVVINDFNYDMDKYYGGYGHCETIDPPRLKRFAVFKLDIGRVFRLVEMDTLEDRLIFLGIQGGCNVIIPGTSLRGSQGFLKRNCIYFPNPNCCSGDFSPLCIGMFNLDDKSIEVLNPESDLIPLSHLGSSCWFIPKL